MLQFKGVELSVPFFPRSITRGDIKYERRGGIYVPLARSKAITITLREFDHSLRQRDFRGLIEWIGHESGQLVAYDVPDGYLNGIFSKLPNTTWGTVFADIKLDFLCDKDPFYHALTESSDSVLNPVTVQRHHVDWRIEQTISTPLTNARWRCDGGDTLELSEVPVGNLVIDSATKSIRVGDTSIMRFLSINSRFPELTTGTHTFQTENGAGGTLYTREAWL